MGHLVILITESLYIYILVATVDAKTNQMRTKIFVTRESLLSVCTDLKEFVAVLPRVKHFFHPLTGVNSTKFRPSGNKQCPEKTVNPFTTVTMNCQQDVLQASFKSLKR